MAVRSVRAGALTLGMLAMLAGSSPASAGLFRAYLSVNGNDASPCTVVQPCRLLPAALAAVNSGGEIWMLDSANFNTAPVNITKSVTILAIPGALGSVVANGGDAIVINTAGVTVTLRNLVVLNFSGGTAGSDGLNGITFSQGTALTVEGCEIYGMSGRGIKAFVGGSAKIAVKNTIIRDNAFRGVSVSGPVTTTMDDVQILNSPTGLLVSEGANVTIANSVVAGSDSGETTAIQAQSSTGPSTIAIDRSVVRTSGIGIIATATGGSSHITVSRTSITNNGIGVQTGISSGTAEVVLDTSTIAGNATGVDTTTLPGGVVTSAQNNVFRFNTNDVAGTLTPLPLM